MLFNSTRFVFFFPAVVAVYFAMPHRFRWVLLLCASYYFYMCWRVGYVALLLISTLVDYCAALMMDRTQSKRARLAWLILSLSTNLGLLFFFKYYNFFAGSLDVALRPFNLASHLPASNLLLPVGISFYTFQTLSYTIEVYRGNQKPRTHLGKFALYVAFFPQLVAGPIERARNLLPQMYERHPFDYDRVTNGMKLMAWGFFKKVVIADRLAILVDCVYADPTQHEGFGLTLATVLFAFQIFCDFSGYSDIAIGAAQVFGFKLMANFRRPYHAASVAEFWGRWHISLSTWFRDYVYIPLGGNRVSKIRWHFNIMAVFLLSGLWHGADWRFVIWGALHGTYLLAGRALMPVRERAARLLRLDQVPRLHQALRIAATFILVDFAWIFFRARNLSDAVYIVTHLGTGWHVVLEFQQLRDTVASMCLLNEFLIAIAMLAAMECVHLLQTRTGVIAFVARRPIWVRWAAYSLLVWCIFLFGIFTHKEFIYFRF